MTVKEFKKLPIGTAVRWRYPDGTLSNILGTVRRIRKGDKYVVWQDGQQTDGTDDHSLQSVELAV